MMTAPGGGDHSVVTTDQRGPVRVTRGWDRAMVPVRHTTTLAGHSQLDSRSNMSTRESGVSTLSKRTLPAPLYQRGADPLRDPEPRQASRGRVFRVLRDRKS